MMISCVVFLTDFGATDWYVAAMKGSVLSRAPESTLVDLSHTVPPGDVAHADFLLEQTWRWYPPESVFVVVVDPGVGTERRAIAVRAAERMFVAPDNGVLTSALEEPGAEVREIDPERVGAGPLSATFHGRDLFAPAAAALAEGAAFASVGELTQDAVRLPRSQPSLDGDRAQAHVVYVDRFGNAITDLKEGDLREWLGKAKLRVQAGTAEIEGLSRTYGDAPTGTALALIGSTGRLEIAVADAHAGTRLGLAPGTTIELSKK
ncbi:MAG TPA: SAM-dependent chlorinase/fluorinase [Candidatus Eisenbacteria bacterium]|nr:SAM-dependent chlorinase/fluorinase [Candidatus Eisenbacteria bacterium]